MFTSSYLILVAICGAAQALPEVRHKHLARAAATIDVDVNTKYQKIDGFGFSEAFRKANNIKNLPTKEREEVLDLLFNTTTGAGLSMLRIGLGSAPNSQNGAMNAIQPVDPGGPDATPKYVWDGDDSGQVAVAKWAYERGVREFYANPWSAPGYMKTTGNDVGGGYLCGVPDQVCSSGDWRKAFANYLAQYVKFYKQEGIPITHLGFLNEPEFAPKYAGMMSNAAQAASFIKILAPAMKAQGLSSVGLTCCDSMGWDAQAKMTAELKTAGAADLLSRITGHAYSSACDDKIPTSLPTWMTEYADLKGPWTTEWYNNGAKGEGMYWANALHVALTKAQVSAYLYWIGVEGGKVNTKLIQVTGETYEVSTRLWAFAGFARAARPGAFRVATTTSSKLLTSAYLNPDGTLGVVVLNEDAADTEATVSLGAFKGRSVTAFVTDKTRTGASLNAKLSGSTVSGSIPGRSLVTFLVSGS
ncbi:uncharacterized protein L3040_008840 [Drepanopeziza brunnea f. sp. 'multigermtubi']|uniref:Cellulosome enzyme n=1 Tax=Marssonina brunnea f. sp. multigermtubi (strain MB_m1) TaxID=1072389 RepID=K1WXF1_MARBU|nr:cellulosome enzyme [Drepanopeziza brunnea f. sp. 'multigermtubi' MB_m1]EKD17197.1 cellulosome enzyme [Drepanopeziza brunnea f. sp. 'multigermtubi' MB_m1]KAJ5032231.1 hypothetical protein L3040_008840 [Drepanopeziza brunnea f. sp. 'multigermtubi']